MEIKRIFNKLLNGNQDNLSKYWEYYEDITNTNTVLFKNIQDCILKNVPEINFDFIDNIHKEKYKDIMYDLVKDTMYVKDLCHLDVKSLYETNITNITNIILNSTLDTRIEQVKTFYYSNNINNEKTQKKQQKNIFDQYLSIWETKIKEQLSNSAMFNNYMFFNNSQANAIADLKIVTKNLVLLLCFSSLKNYSHQKFDLFLQVFHDKYTSKIPEWKNDISAICLFARKLYYSNDISTATEIFQKMFCDSNNNFVFKDTLLHIYFGYLFIANYNTPQKKVASELFLDTKNNIKSFSANVNKICKLSYDTCLSEIQKVYQESKPLFSISIDKSGSSNDKKKSTSASQVNITEEQIYDIIAKNLKIVEECYNVYIGYIQKYLYCNVDNTLKKKNHSTLIEKLSIDIKNKMIENTNLLYSQIPYDQNKIRQLINVVSNNIEKKCQEVINANTASLDVELPDKHSLNI